MQNARRVYSSQLRFGSVRSEEYFNRFSTAFLQSAGFGFGAQKRSQRETLQLAHLQRAHCHCRSTGWRRPRSDCSSFKIRIRVNEHHRAVERLSFWQQIPSAGHIANGILFRLELVVGSNQRGEGHKTKRGVGTNNDSLRSARKSFFDRRPDLRVQSVKHAAQGCFISFSARGFLIDQNTLLEFFCTAEWNPFRFPARGNHHSTISSLKFSLT